LILEMVRVRVLGPRRQLASTIEALQDLELMHLDAPPSGDGLVPVSRSPREERHLGQVRAILHEIDAAIAMLPRRADTVRVSVDSAPTQARIPQWARTARRVRRRLEQLGDKRNRLEQERALLARTGEFLEAFAALEEHGGAASPTVSRYPLLLRAGAEKEIDRLRSGLAAALEDNFELRDRRLPGGEVAVLLVVDRAQRERVDSLLQGSGIEELPAPAGCDVTRPEEWRAWIRARLEEISQRLSDIDSERERLDRKHGNELELARRVLQDRAIGLVAIEQTAATEHAFVIEGWLPSGEIERLEPALDLVLGDSGVVERLASEKWSREETPVVLKNPPLFRPFEVVVGLLPLPRYGSIDPTPFTAAFFPMFFGLILGDVGYGLILALLGGVFRHRTSRGSTGRSISNIAIACASFAILFGVLYGELFGDLGRRRLGMEALLIDREETLLGFLGLAFAIGIVHVVLGLILGILGAWRGGRRREALGRGVALSMLAMVVLALLAAFEVLPHALLTPMVVAVLVAFPALLILEGVLGPIELLSTMGNVLSYARIMALGTASVVMAVVANRMIGITGSVAVGALFALLFHTVNFAVGVFSPTIHALRLHYVEFFGKFYSPGGIVYRPLGHWRPSAATAGGSVAEEG
jgi:V/A-type H+-transporting ATPase subunit I